jgi:hypothetical protein
MLDSQPGLVSLAELAGAWLVAYSVPVGLLALLSLAHATHQAIGPVVTARLGIALLNACLLLSAFGLAYAGQSVPAAVMALVFLFQLLYQPEAVAGNIAGYRERSVWSLAVALVAAGVGA